MSRRIDHARLNARRNAAESARLALESLWSGERAGSGIKMFCADEELRILRRFVGDEEALRELRAGTWKSRLAEERQRRRAER